MFVVVVVVVFVVCVVVAVDFVVLYCRCRQTRLDRAMCPRFRFVRLAHLCSCGNLVVHPC